MPLNYDRLLSEIRDDLDQPDMSAPSDDAIMRAIGDVSQLMHLQAQNTGEAWSHTYVDLTVSANQPYYALNEDRYGKPVRVYTVDPTDVNHISRKVDLVDRQDIEGYYSGRTVAVDGRKHSAVAMVPYFTDGQAMYEVIPTPAQSATYRIWYETGDIPEPTRGGTIPTQSPFHRYVRVKAATLLLGKCSWSRILGTKANELPPGDVLKLQAAQADRLRPGLVALTAEYEREYKEYIANIQQSGTQEVFGYGDHMGGW
jgi:hypothetical protein